MTAPTPKKRAALFALLVLAVGAAVAWLALGPGPVVDVTTSPNDPPGLPGAPYPTEAGAQLAEACGPVAPLTLEQAVPHAYEAALAELEARGAEGWALVAMDNRQGLIRGIVEGPGDAWIVRVRPAGERGAVVDLRWRSAAGAEPCAHVAAARALLEAIEARVHAGHH